MELIGMTSEWLAANIVRPICTAPAMKLKPANTPIRRRLENVFCKYVFTPYTGRAKANTVMYVAMELTLSMVNAPAWYRVTSGSANTSVRQKSCTVVTKPPSRVSVTLANIT